MGSFKRFPGECLDIKNVLIVNNNCADKFNGLTISNISNNNRKFGGVLNSNYIIGTESIVEYDNIKVDEGLLEFFKDNYHYICLGYVGLVTICFLVVFCYFYHKCNVFEKELSKLNEKRDRKRKYMNWEDSRSGTKKGFCVNCVSRDCKTRQSYVRNRLKHRSTRSSAPRPVPSLPIPQYQRIPSFCQYIRSIETYSEPSQNLYSKPTTPPTTLLSTTSFPTTPPTTPLSKTSLSTTPPTTPLSTVRNSSSSSSELRSVPILPILLQYQRIPSFCQYIRSTETYTEKSPNLHAKTTAPPTKSLPTVPPKTSLSTVPPKTTLPTVQLTTSLSITSLPTVPPTISLPTTSLTTTSLTRKSTSACGTSHQRQTLSTKSKRNQACSCHKSVNGGVCGTSRCSCFKNNRKCTTDCHHQKNVNCKN